MMREEGEGGRGHEKREAYQGGGDEGKAAVLDERHERVMNALDVGVVDGRDTLHLVQGGLHRLLVVGLRLVAAVDVLGRRALGFLKEGKELGGEEGKEMDAQCRGRT